MHIIDRFLIAMKVFFQLSDPRTAAENMLKEATMQHLESHDAVMYYTCQRQYYAHRIAYLRDYLGYDKHPAQPENTDSQPIMEARHVSDRDRLEQELKPAGRPARI